jgi:hypothetical protein
LPSPWAQWVAAAALLQKAGEGLVSGLATGMIAEEGEAERDLDPWEMDSSDDEEEEEGH